MRTHRLFVAIDPPADTVAIAARLIERLRRAGVDARWTDPARLHLTLAFLGDDVPDDVIGPLRAALDAAAAPAAPFTIGFGGLGAFPDLRRPRVIWLGVRAGAEELVRLHAAISAGLERLGFPPDDRGFHPHLTLGRIHVPRTRRPRALDLAPLCDRLGEAAGSGQVTQVSLYASVADEAGHRYERLHAAQLAAGACPPE